MPVRMTESTLRRRFPVQPRTRGGYERVDIPDPDDLVSPEGRAIAMTERPNLSELREQARQQDEADRARFEASLKEASDQGFVDTVGMRNLNLLRQGQVQQSSWTPWLQALKNVGVDKLAADAGFSAPSYNPQAGLTTQTRQPGFFGTQTPGQQRAYDPREAQAGGPAGAPAQQAASRLAGGSAYDPQASQRALRALRGLYQGYGVRPGYNIF